jgi:23S rRNA (uridine2552-2'-O)-methyltransferase
MMRRARSSGGAGGKGGAKGGGTRGTSGRSVESRPAKRLVDGKNRKPSSRRWLERQLNDPYVRRARAEGYASRAAFKLAEIDDRHKFIAKGSRVIDLGAAPGGWLQVAVERTGSRPTEPKVVGIDILDMDAIPGTIILKMDFLDPDAPRSLLEVLKGEAPDIVLSDMAASTTGHRRTDHLRTMALVEAALEFAVSALRPGGHFLCKTFQGGTEGELLTRLKRNFQSVHHVKPPASRNESVELYLLAKGFKGRD